MAVNQMAGKVGEAWCSRRRRPDRSEMFLLESSLRGSAHRPGDAVLEERGRRVAHVATCGGTRRGTDLATSPEDCQCE